MPPSANKPLRHVACGFAVLALAVGCGGYDAVSPLGYDYAKALYSICNRKSEPELAPLRERIEKSHDEKNLPDRDAQWLTEIITDAEAGKWEDARSDARQLMEDQVTGR